jgi:homoserine O-acetyltransferase
MRGLLVFILCCAAAATAQTPALKSGDALLPDFHFASGETFPQLKIHYRTLGVQKRDALGRVTNAVLVLHGTSGSGTQFLGANFADELFEAGQPLDASKYFIIIPDGIGHGQSSKPSDGMHAHFPHYGYRDMVEAQHRLLTEALKVDHLRLLIGTSMGCMHAYVWAERYPDFLQAAMPLACAPAEIAGRNLAWRRVLIDAIQGDPAWQGGEYKQQPPSLRTAIGIISLVSGNPLTWQHSGPTRDKAIEYLGQSIDNRLRGADANDILYAVDASRDYNPTPGLASIRTPILHINSADDTINPPELKIAEELLKSVPSAKFELLPYTAQTHGHGTHTMAALWKDRLARFLAETEK